MGAHYGSIHILTQDSDLVRQALEKLSGELGLKFLIAPPAGEWIAVFPEHCGQDFEVSKRLAESIQAPMWHGLVHDDDLFAYQYFEQGALRDQYHSKPEYFSGQAGPKGGDVAALRAILPDESVRKKFADLLLADGFAFETERFERAVAILGLKNAPAAYESLLEGERKTIRDWRKFVRIPDPKPERAAKRAAEAAAKATGKRLAGEGILLFEEAPKPKKYQRLHGIWCINPASRKILLGWVDHAGPGTPMAWLDAASGERSPAEIELANTAFEASISPDGRWLAVGHASGRWETELIDLHTGRIVTHPQQRAISWLGFSPDGKTLCAVSEQSISIIRGPGWQNAQTVKLPGYCRSLAMHPDGKYWVAEEAGKLVVMDMSATPTIKTHWIDAMPGPKRDLLEAMHARMGSTLPTLPSAELLALRKLVTARMDAQAMEAYQRQMKLQFLPKQHVSVLMFSRDGRQLICGTDEGLCVLDWEALRAAQDMTPQSPVRFVATQAAEPTENGGPAPPRLYTLAIDPLNGRILFAGRGGAIRSLDLASGDCRDLPIPPSSWSCLQMRITPDRQALICHHVMINSKRSSGPVSCLQIWNYPALARDA